MKHKTIIDNEKEEVLIYTPKVTNKITMLERYIEDLDSEIIAFRNKTSICLSYNDVICFTIENGRSFAITEKEKLLIKRRLFQIEEMVSENFVKINQSSIANITKIERFDASIGGNLMVIFKNGYKDYVSRRQTKLVKERIGFKK